MELTPNWPAKTEDKHEKPLSQDNRRSLRDSIRTQVRSVIGSRNLRIQFENDEGFRVELILTFRPLQMGLLHCLERWETDYPVRQNHIPEKRKHQLRRCETLRTFTQPNSIPQNFPAAHIFIYIYIYIYTHDFRA